MTTVAIAQVAPRFLDQDAVMPVSVEPGHTRSGELRLTLGTLDVCTLQA